MGIKSSPETVRDMKNTLSNTVKDIQDIQKSIATAISATSGWNDAQGQQYQALMKKISQLTQTPITTLNAAIPKLEKLAQSLDNYKKVKF